MDRKQSDLDFSTINTDLLMKLPVFTLHAMQQKRYHLQENPGNGCYLDAPGYPTYYTRNVYTRNDNDVNGGTTVIMYNGIGYDVSDIWTRGDTWDVVYARHDALMKSLWRPLPIDHVRVQLWIMAVYRHMQHCYHSPEKDKNGSNIVIWPVPSYELQNVYTSKYALDRYKSVFDMRDEQRAAIVHNTAMINKRAQLIDPDNHCAVRMVRQFYPDHVANWDYIDGKIPARVGDDRWWECSNVQS
jgi:hypothetical protein